MTDYPEIPWGPPPPPAPQATTEAVPSPRQKKRYPVEAIPHRPATPEPSTRVYPPEPTAAPVMTIAMGQQGGIFDGFLGPLWVDGLASSSSWLILFQVQAKWDIGWLGWLLSWQVVLISLFVVALVIPVFAWGIVDPSRCTAEAETGLVDGEETTRIQEALELYATRQKALLLFRKIYALIVLNVLVFSLTAFLSS